MGTYFGWDSQEDLVRHLLDEGESRIIASSLEMTGFREPVLWQVREQDGERWIECCCLIYRADLKHAYKRYGEADGPFAPNCPLEFLEMAPARCEEWRRSVRNYHKGLGSPPFTEVKTAVVNEDQAIRVRRLELSGEKDEPTGVGRLRAHLATIQPGDLTDTTYLERLLAASWDEFTGDDGGMEGYKFLGRIEDVAWQPPKLSFTIERHGGTVLGSTRAELQHWEVNVEQKSAVIVKCGHRQLKPMAERIYIKPLVESILAAIRSGSGNELVEKHEDGTFSLNTTLIFPKGSAVKMTLEGRRKRLREAVASVLLKEGWKRRGKDIFQPPTG